VILDTNALSAFGSSRIGMLLRKAEQPAVPVIVLGEFQYGVTHSTRSRYYEEWLERYLPGFRILEITMGQRQSTQVSALNSGTPARRFRLMTCGSRRYAASMIFRC